MITITQQQFQSLDQVQQARFVNQLAEFLKEEELLEDFAEEDPYELTHKLVMRAEQLGIVSERGIAYFAILVSQFGESLQRISDRPWFCVLLRDKSEPPDPDWIERVFLTVTDCLKNDETDELFTYVTIS